MKFKRFAEYLERIEQTPSRLKMTSVLAELFGEATADEIDQMVYLALGRLRPKYESVEFNLAEKMMFRVMAEAYQVEPAKVKQAFKKTGDLGGAVEELPHFAKASRGTAKDLSVAEVYQRLMDVAADEGVGSQERKVNHMANLIRDLDSLSAKYVLRIPVKKLRLGFSDMTVLDGLSWMEAGDKSLRPQLERAFNVSADIGGIAERFKKGGLAGVAGVKVKVAVPIRTAQAERLPNEKAVVEKLKVFAVEGKYDGLRVQIHVDKSPDSKRKIQSDLFGESKKFVEIFSRNLDNMTHMFPDIVAAADKLKVKTAILDGEAVAFEPKTGKSLPFQETVTRKRKHGVKNKAKEMPLKVIIYDLLYLNGTTLIEKPFKERRKQLEKVLGRNGKTDGLELAEQEIVSEPERLNQLLKKYLKEGLEGVMCKKLTTAYQAGARNFNWVKLKKTSQKELADTIDCVVMGYYAGRGKRSGFGIGAFLVGVTHKSEARSTKSEIGVGSVAKIGTGLTDEQWREIRRRADKLKVKANPEEYVVDKNLAPDVWVRPEMVVEILADEITRSPIHAFGLALRFPRLISFRDDKDVGQATTKRELERLFKLQRG